MVVLQELAELNEAYEAAETEYMEREQQLRDQLHDKAKDDQRDNLVNSCWLRAHSRVKTCGEMWFITGKKGWAMMISI